MPRLIDVSPGQTMESPLAIRVGDVLAFSASGGDVGSGSLVVERLGPFVPAVVGLDGRVLQPEGAPSSVLFVARTAGTASLTVATGDPWRASALTTYLVDVSD